MLLTNGLCSHESAKRIAVDLKRFVDVLRSHWLTIVMVVVRTGATGAFVWHQTPSYTARTQLFVSTPTAPGNLSLTYQGGLFSQQRVLSYSRIVSSPPGRAYRDRKPSAAHERGAAAGSHPCFGSRRHGLDRRERRRSIAPACSRDRPRDRGAIPSLRELVGDTSQGGSTPVKVSVTSPAEIPTTPRRPGRGLALAIAAFLGLVLGIGIAILRSLFDTRIRSASDASYLAESPVLGNVPNYRSSPKAHWRQWTSRPPRARHTGD